MLSYAIIDAAYISYLGPRRSLSPEKKEKEIAW